MSRWKETLCGSVILSKASPSSSVDAVDALESQSDILSCGGIYLPYQKKTLIKKKEEITVFHLAKEQYEVLVNNSEKEMQRFGETMPDESNEIKLFSDNRYLDLKAVK